MFHNKKGFTLVELLVVVAIIAILVSVVIPNVLTVKKKANGAADAANLRSAMGEINVKLADQETMQEIAIAFPEMESKVVPGAKLWIVYGKPACLYTYFVKDGAFYSMDYMVDVARTGKSDRSTNQPAHVAKWYAPGVGWIDPTTGDKK